MQVNNIPVIIPTIYIEPDPNKNPGTVPPWLQDPNTPRIMGNRDTCFIEYTLN